MFGGDDDDDFVPASNSKLATLFSSKSLVEGNSSLTYTAPKQPKRGTSSVKNESRTSTLQPATEPTRPPRESTENMLSIIIVKAVNTYKFQEGKYNPQGKLGAAVLGNDTICVYQLLLYKGKQQHITTTKIYPNFQFTVQASNYATFYDDNKQNWSIHFERNEDAEEFAKEVGLARGNAQGGKGIIKNLLTQELFVGEGPSANVGDSLEIFYTVRAFLDTKLGELIESNLQAEKPQRVKIRKNVWEEGLIGASKGSKRIILLPSNLVGPWKQQVNPNTSIVVEVEINRIKQAKGLGEDVASTMASLADSGESAVDSSTEETSIKARGASISEALTASPKTNKANIISRMAKMGQATLPLKGAVVCNPSDSEETEDEFIRASTGKPQTTSKPSAKSRPSKLRSKPVSTSPSSPPESTPWVGPLKPTNNPPHQVTVYQTAPAAWQQQQQQPYMMGQYGVGQLDGQLYPLVSQQTASSHQLFPGSPNTIVSTPTGIASSENLFSIFMSETRTQNTEVRMGVAKVADKVDQMLAKLDTAQNSKLATSNTIMDPSSLLASIQKMVIENEQLKTELTDKGNKIEIQNDRIYQLLNSNHKYLEQSNCSTNDHRNQEALVANLQNVKVKLTEELCDSKLHIESLLSQIETLKQENAMISSNVALQTKNLLDELSASKSVIVEQDMNLQKLREKMQSSLEANESHEKTMASLRTFVLELQDSKEKAEASLKDVTQQMKFQKLESEDHERKLTSKYSAHIAALMAKGADFKAQLDAKKALDSSVTKPVEEVKKVMNIVCKSLFREFSSGRQYLGENIRDILVTTIRDVTCQFLESTTNSVSASTEHHSALPQHDVTALSLKGGADKISIEPCMLAKDLYSNSPSDFKAQLNHHKQESYPRQIQSLSGDTKSQVDQPNKSCELEAGKPQVPPFENLESADHCLKDINSISVSQAQNVPSNTSNSPLLKLSGGAILTSELPPENKTGAEYVSDSSSPSPQRRAQMMNNDEMKDFVPTVVGIDAVSSNERVCGGDKLETNKLEENLNKKMRESSLERNPWHSEPPPPPLLDDDEDEDDWLS